MSTAVITGHGTAEQTLIISALQQQQQQKAKLFEWCVPVPRQTIDSKLGRKMSKSWQ